MPLPVLLFAIPFLGNVAVSVGTLLWGGAVAGAGVGAILGVKALKASEHLEEARALRQYGKQSADYAAAKVSREHQAWFEQIKTKYVLLYRTVADSSQGESIDASRFRLLSPDQLNHLHDIVISGPDYAFLTKEGFREASGAAVRAMSISHRSHHNPVLHQQQPGVTQDLVFGSIVLLAKLAANSIEEAEKKVTAAQREVASATIFKKGCEAFAEWADTSVHTLAMKKKMFDGLAADCLGYLDEGERCACPDEKCVLVERALTTMELIADLLNQPVFERSSHSS